MDRRAYLAVTGGALSAVAAGCLGSSGDRPADRPGRTTTGSTASETEGSPTATATAGVAIEDVVVRKAVRYESTMGSSGVLAAHDRQYVVASVRGGRDRSAAEFAFEAGGESWAPGLPDTAGGVNYAVAGHEGGPVDRRLGRDRSYLAFAVPSPLSASRPRIRLAGPDDVEWPLSAALRKRLAAPAPRFELDALEAPDEVSQGEPVSVSLSVTNVSETAGRFLAAVYWPTKLVADDDEATVLERNLAAGEGVTVSREIDTSYTTDEPESVTLSVRGHVAAERTVRVRDVSTPA